MDHERSTKLKKNATKGIALGRLKKDLLFDKQRYLFPYCEQYLRIVIESPYVHILRNALFMRAEITKQ